MQFTKERKLILLEILFAVLMVVSNVVNQKVLNINSILLPGSAFIYVITFFISNVISEGWGKDEAKICLFQGIGCNIIATVMYIIVRIIPAQDPNMQQAFVTLLGMNWIFVVADITACVISQFSQIVVFNKLREVVRGSVGNMLSMLMSQFIDTLIFLGIAFGIGSAWLFNPEGRMMFLNMFTSQYIIKIIIAFALTALFSRFAFSKSVKSTSNNNLEGVES